MPETYAPLIEAVGDWYRGAKRELPWRGDDVPAWAVMVSEFMLQQTPVARVLPVFEEWMQRWPTPHDLAADSPGEAVRMWGKLGYPRRALRLHAAAVAIDDRHGGDVPSDPAALKSLPGVGDYTAAAVAAFAFGQRIAVVDTNVRRVVHRAVLGAADAGPSTTRADFALVDDMLPDDPAQAAHVSIALMELGALVCTSKSPRCADCPVVAACAWVAAGKPAYDGPPKRAQRFAGTDRQVRGLLMDVLRGADEAVPRAELDVVWSDDVQRQRALQGLLSDGLVVLESDGRYALPSGRP
ncbi:A/G-specific adenine glycosylase [Cumulibacter soli]|uniref:A/G-specific adenine glycosylase n=1 Tax=Cumulibacter soli TaxID=2546344 RepID=UPI0010681842|nr:A/G-specific adenine glycosylase [Cumulibacter soli]